VNPGSSPGCPSRSGEVEKGCRPGATGEDLGVAHLRIVCMPIVDAVLCFGKGRRRQLTSIVPFAMFSDRVESCRMWNGRRDKFGASHITGWIAAEPSSPGPLLPRCSATTQPLRGFIVSLKAITSEATLCSTCHTSPSYHAEDALMLPATSNLVLLHKI